METKRKHVPTWLYKLGGRLDKQYEEIVSALSDICLLYTSMKAKLSSEIIVKQKVGQHPHINVTDNDDMEQWDAVIMGNDELLEMCIRDRSTSACTYFAHHVEGARPFLSFAGVFVEPLP